MASIHIGDTRHDLGAARFDIVFGANGNGQQILLTTDHMFGNGDEFVAKGTMGNDDNSDHKAVALSENRKLGKDLMTP